MSSVTVNENIFCGFLGLEAKENSGVFSKKFFRLDPKGCKLQYYSDNKNKQGTETQPDGCFNISFMSRAADAGSVRPKVPHCFYIVVSGQKHYFQADTECEKSTWIDKLLDASRITVQQRQSLIERSSESGFLVQVVGGVVVKTPIEHEKSEGPSSVEHSSTLRPSSPCCYDDNVLKEGYCVKQGVFRKSWKRRFFVLTSSSLMYCRTLEDKIPLKTIAVGDIKDVRRSVGMNRENAFEVVTDQRVFIVQASSVSDRDSWISAMSQITHKVTNCQDHERA